MRTRGFAARTLLGLALAGLFYAPAFPADPPAQPALARYVIQQDDTLWDLAGSFYGKPWLWPLFLKFNSIPNPDLIYPGQALLFPQEQVLLNIKEKSDEQVKKIREDMEKQATPVDVESPPAPRQTVPPTPEPTPVATQAAAPVTEAVEPPATPIPPPQKTPTLKVSGSKTINLSYGEAIGNSGNGFTNTGFDRHETLRLQVEGQLNDAIKIVGHFAQSDLALEDEYDLTLSAHNWELFVGNFQASLPGSKFLSSGLSTTGVKLTGKYDGWNVTSFYATPRGRPVYQKFFGNNTQGPYLVSGAPLSPGSETLRLNGKPLTRGVDYYLDTNTGNLTFVNRIILLTELIEIETQSRSAQFDTEIYGYRAEVALLGGKLSTAFPTPGAAPVMGAILPGGSPFRPQGDAQAVLSGLTGSVTGTGTATPGKTPTPAAASTKSEGVRWTLGQGYMRQLEQPDASVNTSTGRVAADTHLLELDTELDFGPPLKLSGEIDGSLYKSSNESLSPSREGAAYRLQADTFQGPFHVQGNFSGTTPNFTSIGSAVISGDFLEWSLLGDFKEGEVLFAKADRNFQRRFLSGIKDETTTDHGEVRVKPKGLPEAEYVYYHSDENRQDIPTPFQQGTERHTGSLGFAFAGLTAKVSALTESKSGTNLGVSRSYGGKVDVASAKWPNFNFALSGEWKMNDIVEAASNTLVPSATPGNNILSQTYTYTMEGKPFTHLTLTGRGSYSNDPPGPPKANVTQAFQTDPFKWLTANGNYSLDFQQSQVLGKQVPSFLHTAAGSLEIAPFPWMKWTAQPSLRVDALPDYGQRALSENFHQNYRLALTPSFMGLNGDYTLDQFQTWDGSTAGFPLNFHQQTETLNVSARKPLGKIILEGGYKRSDQNQINSSAVTTTSSRTLTQNETDSLNWNTGPVLTITLGHAYNQMDRLVPGAGDIDNPLLPNGADTFNTTFPLTGLNAKTQAHTFTGRATEQITKELSIYQEGGYTRTLDLLKDGGVDTYSPAAGFTWKIGSFLNWSASYQYNASSGLVSTGIQKAQTTLSATFNPGSALSVNWNFTQANNPFLRSQQGTASYTMNF